MAIIKRTQGNTLAVYMPLTQRTLHFDGSVVEEPYHIEEGDDITITLQGLRQYRYHNPQPFEDGIVFTLYGTEVAGTYTIETTIIKADKTRLRCFSDDTLLLSRRNDENQGDELQTEGITLDESIFFFAKGEKGDKGDTEPQVVQFISTTPAAGGTYYSTQRKQIEVWDDGPTLISSHTPLTTVLYVNKVDGHLYRWTGSAMLQINPVTYAQTTGTSTTAAMSQKATTDALEANKNTTNAYDSLDKVSDYLYTAKYGGCDYAYAKEYFKGDAPVNLGACSSMVANGVYGRNYDWHYNNEVSFLVQTPADNGKHAVMGIASVPTLDKSIVETGEHSELYRILPFYLQDGINDAGLVCNINVVPNDKGDNSLVQCAGEVEDTLCVLMLVRYILDHFASVEDAYDYIFEHINLYHPQALLDAGYNVHFMIADSTKTYVLEFSNGNFVYTDQFDKLTNFHVSDIALLDDGKVFTQFDIDGTHKPSDYGITDNASGLERYNLMVDANITDEVSMRSLMNSLMFTNAYTKILGAFFWYSEFVGGNMGIDTPVTNTAYLDRIASAKQDYQQRQRGDGKTWQTTHSCVYDLAAKTLNIVVQEDTANEHDFTLQAVTYEQTTGQATDKAMSQKAVTDALDGKVSTSTKVNGKALTGDITLDATDIQQDAIAGEVSVDQALHALDVNKADLTNEEQSITAHDIVFDGNLSLYLDDDDNLSLGGDKLLQAFNVKQTTGQSTTDLMSQKAVTDELADKQPIKPIVASAPDMELFLTPYQVVDFGERASLNVGIEGTPVANLEYEFLFSSGATPTTVTFPQGIDLGDFSPKANKSYDCIIYNSKLYYYEW